ncbi:MAG: prepilin-type N-terminal cleavage/methylation domain-containing protein [Nitrospiria bacterium]
MSSRKIKRFRIDPPEKRHGKRPPPGTRIQSLGGFTLLEIMVALTVLSISLVVLLGLRNKDIALSAHARRITEATLLARLKITEIKTEGFPDLGEQQGDFGETAPKYQWRQEVRLTPFDAVRELILHVTWRHDTREEAVRMTAYLFNDA